MTAATSNVALGAEASIACNGFSACWPEWYILGATR